jgi:hypothetical protein
LRIRPDSISETINQHPPIAEESEPKPPIKADVASVQFFLCTNRTCKHGECVRSMNDCGRPTFGSGRDTVADR